MHRLLLAAASAGSEATRAARVEAALRARVDFAEIASEARRHAVIPLVDRALAAQRDAVAVPGLTLLRREARQLAYRSVYLTGALVGLADAFEDEAIPAVFYKGPILAQQVYGSVALRSFTDLDVLVRRRDFVRAQRRLVADGFLLHRDEWLSVRQLGHEVPFDRDGGRLQLDLHRSPLSRELMALDEEEVWERVVPVTIGGRRVRSFDTEATLWLLCEHAHKHLWERLSWLADVARLIAANPRLDWKGLHALAERAGGDRVVRTGLLLAAELLDAPVPGAELSAARQDAGAVELAAAARVKLFAPVSEDAEAEGREVARAQWRARSRWRDRWRLATTPNERDWILLPLPAALSPLYYVVRFFRLAVSYGRELFSRRSSSWR